MEGSTHCLQIKFLSLSLSLSPPHCFIYGCLSDLDSHCLTVSLSISFSQSLSLFLSLSRRLSPSLLLTSNSVGSRRPVRSGGVYFKTSDVVSSSTSSMCSVTGSSYCLVVSRTRNNISCRTPRNFSGMYHTRSVSEELSASSTTQ
jgi:hypothetical protein